MNKIDIIKKLLLSYKPHSFINWNGEFIPNEKSGCYFKLNFDERLSEKEIKIQVLHYLSRGYKEEPYYHNFRNVAHQTFMNKAFNEYLGTSFTSDEIKEIYTKFGNGSNKELARIFYDSGCDINLLKNKEEY
ncbi:MAG: hypothetical protein ACRCST_17220 [Turicibacter sp.]